MRYVYIKHLVCSMYKKFSLLFITMVGLWISIFHTGCAVMIPPNGGPKDSLPPVLMQAVPELSTTNFNTNKIVLNFDEYVELKGMQDNLIVSPLPKSNPVVDYKLKTVTIKLRDSLKPNTTYTLDFGNGLVDVNEGNALKGFTYVFSTGKYIDSNRISGNVMLAETGVYDSTLIAVLYSNLNDTAVLKTKPKYMARVDSKGNFKFQHLPDSTYNVFVMPNEYSKRYDDTTKMFAFMDSSIHASTNPAPLKLFAYQEAKKKEKKPPEKKPEKKKLTFTTSLDNYRQDLLAKSLTLTFSNKLKEANFNMVKITDTSYNTIINAVVIIDTALSRIVIKNQWKAADNLRLILNKKAATDTFGNNLEKSDTIKFVVGKEEEYGSLKIRFKNIDLNKNPVIQFLVNDLIVESKPLTGKDIFFKLFHPGEYDIRVLYDENKNGIWDPGNYKKNLQPETVQKFKNKIPVKANWDNEAELVF